MKSNLKAYEHFVTAETIGGKMFLNPKDQYISRDLIRGGVWEPYLDDIFEKFINAGDCVVDVGANIGAHSLKFSRLVGWRGSVHCFEPFEELCFQLKHNMLLNKCHNAVIYRYGLSDSSEILYVPPLDLQRTDNFGAKFLHQAERRKSRELSERIEMITLDSLELCPDFLKIDAEGMENSVLIGARNTITGNNPIILVEIHQQDLPEVTSTLKQLGYSIREKFEPWDYLALPNR